MRMRCLVWLAVACWLRAQNGQQGPRPEWPCVAGRAVDPSFLETSESTGGQLFLFQKSEVAQTTPFLTASHTHPATVVRAVGTLSGEREFEFPVDSTVESLLVMASLQCRAAISVFRPSGVEMTAANTAQSVDLQASRLLRVDNPEPGAWKVRLKGTGLYVLSVQVRSPVNLHASASFDGEPSGQARISGEVGNPHFQLIDAGGEELPGMRAESEEAEGMYRFPIALRAGRFRIRMAGVDASGWPLQRTDPVLFRAERPK